MNALEELICSAEQKDYLYIETDSQRQPSKALRVGGSCAIFINERAFKTQSERLVALAHEIGHCDTGSFYNIYSPFDVRERHENRANKKAILTLIPLDKLIDAVEGGAESIFELSEHFNVTDNFIRMALRHYEAALKEEHAKRRGGEETCD